MHTFILVVFPGVQDLYAVFFRLPFFSTDLYAVFSRFGWSQVLHILSYFRTLFCESSFNTHSFYSIFISAFSGFVCCIFLFCTLYFPFLYAVFWVLWERLSVKVRGFCGFCKSHSLSWPVGALWDSRHTGAYGPEMGGGMAAGGDRKLFGKPTDRNVVGKVMKHESGFRLIRF